MELYEYSALEQAELIRTKQVSSEELLDAILTQVSSADADIHAFVTVCEKEAREKAKNIDRKIAAGEAAGRLAGVPYSAKDVFCTRGIRTTAGSKILGSWIPPYNAAAI